MLTIWGKIMNSMCLKLLLTDLRSVSLPSLACRARCSESRWHWLTGCRRRGALCFFLDDGGVENWGSAWAENTAERVSPSPCVVSVDSLQNWSNTTDFIYISLFFMNDWSNHTQFLIDYTSSRLIQVNLLSSMSARHCWVAQSLTKARDSSEWRIILQKNLIHVSPILYIS